MRLTLTRVRRRILRQNGNLVKLESFHSRVFLCLRSSATDDLIVVFSQIVQSFFPFHAKSMFMDVNENSICNVLQSHKDGIPKV